VPREDHQRGGEVPDLWYSGKAHAHGGNIQAVCAPDGFPLRGSGVEPGSVHDITAVRLHALPALYRAAARGLPALAELQDTATVRLALAACASDLRPGSSAQVTEYSQPGIIRC
jgi:hypothetical protein